MPSFNDAYNELQTINAKISALHADNMQLLADQAAIKAAIETGTLATQAVQASVDAGTDVLKNIVQEQHDTNVILSHLSRQADTMICALEAISRNTCSIYNETHIQTGVQTVMVGAQKDLLDIAKTVNPSAALDLERREAQKKATETCCPPQDEPLACQYKPCPSPQPLSVKDTVKAREKTGRK